MVINKPKNLKAQYLFNFLYFCIFTGMAFILLALIGAGLRESNANKSDMSFLLTDLLPRLSKTTLTLIIGVLIGSTTIAISLSFAMRSLSNKAQKVITPLLTLPIIFPIYIYAFIYIGVFEWASPLSITLRDKGLFALLNIDFINLKNIWGAIFIFSLALYPYIFIPLNHTMKNRWNDFFHTANLLQQKKYRIYLDFLKAYGKAPLFFGCLIIALECLSEFGAVSIIGIDTFTTAIYTAVTSFYSVEMAARIGFLLILIALIFLALEKYFNREEKIEELNAHLPPPKVGKVTQFLSFTIILVTLTFCIGIPMAQLSFWSMDAVNLPGLKEVFSLLKNGFLLATITGIILVITSIFLIISTRFFFTSFISFVKKYISPLALIGYGIPGNLIAVSLLYICSILFPKGMAFELGLIVLIIGLIFKFLRTTYKQIEMGNQYISKDIESTAYILNNHDKKNFIFKIFIPLLRPYMLYGFLLVSIEVLKEMPLTLILRPMGYNTIATKIYELTSEGEWELTAIYTFPLILACLGIHFILQFLEHKNGIKNDSIN